MKINWFSNSPWSCTGYGNQTKLFVPRIKSLGHQMSITAFYGLQGGIIDLGDVKIFPVVKHSYGQDVVGAHARVWGADVLISLVDAWVMQPDNMMGVPWYPWFPVDTEPVHQPIVAKIKQARKGIAMSRFGQKELAKQGIDTYYVPHGVETNVFKPGNRLQARRICALPEERYIVGMVAANKSRYPIRKAFVEQIAAFAEFKKAVDPTALLYIHTDDGSIKAGEAIDMRGLIAAHGLKFGYLNPNGIPADIDVVMCDQYQYAIGYPDDLMVALYNSFDVLLMVSMGEGFGIPLIEAQACGIPVITGEWTSMGELCFSGWKVRRSEAVKTWIEGFGSYMYTPLVEPIVDRLIKAHGMRYNPDYGKRARDGAMAYDADKVLEKYWKPVLEDIQRTLAGQETELELVKF